MPILAGRRSGRRVRQAPTSLNTAADAGPHVRECGVVDLVRASSERRESRMSDLAVRAIDPRLRLCRVAGGEERTSQNSTRPTSVHLLTAGSWRGGGGFLGAFDARDWWGVADYILRMVRGTEAPFRPPVGARARGRWLLLAALEVGATRGIAVLRLETGVAQQRLTKTLRAGGLRPACPFGLTATNR